MSANMEGKSNERQVKQGARGFPDMAEFDRFTGCQLASLETADSKKNANCRVDSGLAGMDQGNRAQQGRT